jgi:hypothetical protein
VTYLHFKRGDEIVLVDRPNQDKTKQPGRLATSPSDTPPKWLHLYVPYPSRALQPSNHLVW